MSSTGKELCEEGWRYQYGVDFEKNLHKAFEYYQKAACKGDGIGMFQVGEFYYLGILVEENKQKAFEYFLKSANVGNPEGIFKTAICYKYGIGIGMSFACFKEWIAEDIVFADSISFLSIIHGMNSSEFKLFDRRHFSRTFTILGALISYTSEAAIIFSILVIILHDIANYDFRTMFFIFIMNMKFYNYFSFYISFVLFIFFVFFTLFDVFSIITFIYFIVYAKIKNSHFMFLVLYLSVCFRQKESMIIHVLCIVPSILHYYFDPFFSYCIDFFDSYHDTLVSRMKRNSKHGKCASCNGNNTCKAWCLTCDTDITIQGWTSGNFSIDYCIKAFQIRSSDYESMIEWIPFDRLYNIKKIGEGGISSVFSVIWLDGIRTINDINGICVRTRKPHSIVALKKLVGIEYCFTKGDQWNFLREFVNHMKCRMFGSKLKVYGLTQNPETNEHFMVYQYANMGSLHNFLSENYRILSWKLKIDLLLDISEELFEIHRAGLIHSDLHSGNILIDQSICKSIQPYISDLGVSKRNDCISCISKGIIYGVLPYVAPERLNKSADVLTKAADIYSFGIIMSEVSTGQRPFDGDRFDGGLAIKIIRGLRPEFAPGTPNFYIEFAKKCMNSDPQKRPTAYNVYLKIKEWSKSMKRFYRIDNIKMQFLEADKIVKELPIILPKHPNHTYTSRPINTREISREFMPSKIIDLCIEE